VSGLRALTFVRREVDLSPKKKAAERKGYPNAKQGHGLQRGVTLPPDLEELDRRLEAAFVHLPDLHANDLCVWACACFLIHGGTYTNAPDPSRS
jgi:hypothetical protein